MEKVFFSLELRDDNRLTKIFRIIFGILCCAIAIFWIIFNFVSVKTDGTQWITFLFLIAFGLFQIYSGFGLATKFIEINSELIKLKKNSIMPAISLPANQIDKIELFPLNVVFFTKPDKKTILRFGISNPEKIDLIKDEIVKFAELNRLSLEVKTELV